jgi:1-acyl-sn-glycerol-3-phosphate acyltransferase
LFCKKLVGWIKCREQHREKAMSAEHYIPRNSRGFNKLLKLSYGSWLKYVYRIRHEGDGFLKELKPPYIIVANHVTTRDPFIIGMHCPEPIYWITGDGVMRTSFIRFFLGLVGSIPKSKAIPDIKTISWVMDVVRKRKGVVGVFPEGQQSWDGHTLPITPASAKLVKLLKVPVVAVRIKGAYMALPRWTWQRRRGKVTAEWELILGPEELRALPVEDILARLEAGIAHDESSYEEREAIEFRSTRRAEFIELSLFMCPDCEGVGRLRSRGNRLHCGACGSTFILDRYGRFRKPGGASPRFRTIRDWDQWQKGAFGAAVGLAAAASREGGSCDSALGDPRKPSRPFISDPGAVLFHGRRMNPLRRIRTGTLVLYPDRLELATLLGERLAFPLADLDGVGVLKRNQLEFYHHRDLYQVRFALRMISARKWAEAISLFKQRADSRQGEETTQRHAEGRRI